MLELERRVRIIPMHPGGAEKEPELEGPGMETRGSMAVTSEGSSQRPGPKEGISTGTSAG